jgi:putative transposase
VRRTSHGLYALSYTFLFIPRFPQTRLVGDIKEHLESWMTHLALIHGWRITSLMIAPDHVEVSIDCAPSEAPEKVVKALMDGTAEKVMAEFPRIAGEHASAPEASGRKAITSSRPAAASPPTRSPASWITSAANRALGRGEARQAALRRIIIKLKEANASPLLTFAVANAADEIPHVHHEPILEQ